MIETGKPCVPYHMKASNKPVCTIYSGIKVSSTAGGLIVNPLKQYKVLANHCVKKELLLGAAGRQKKIKASTAADKHLLHIKA